MKFDARDYSPGRTMKMIREWTELSQSKFGKTIGVDRQRIANYEMETTRFTFEFVLDVARKHGIKIIFEKEDKISRRP